MPCPPGFGIELGADVVAELDASVSIETAVGLFVPACWAVGVGGDCVGEGVRVVLFELKA